LCVNIAWGWSNSVQEDKARAEGLLLPAIERDANNVRARMALGLLRRLQNRLEESRVEWETAIALQPYNAHAFLELGLTLIYLGRPEAGIPQIQKATRLGPYDSSTPAAFSALAHGHLLLGDTSRQSYSRGRPAPTSLRYISRICCWRRRSHCMTNSTRPPPLWPRGSGSDHSSIHWYGCALIPLGAIPVIARCARRP